jgi:hypothetical protein
VTAPLEPPRYQVRIEIPRLRDARGWKAAAAAFEQGLAGHASLLVTQRQIELVTRQGRDYVRVSATVEASNIGEAAVVTWAVLQQAMAEDADGWDIAGASAEIRPARNARLPGPAIAYDVIADRADAGAGAVRGGQSPPSGPVGRRPGDQRKRPARSGRAARSIASPRSPRSTDAARHQAPAGR